MKPHVILTFNPSKTSSFEQVHRIFNEVIKDPQEIQVTLVGTHLSKDAEVQVTREQALKFVADHGLQGYVECHLNESDPAFEEWFAALRLKLADELKPTEPVQPVPQQPRGFCYS